MNFSIFQCCFPKSRETNFNDVKVDIDDKLDATPSFMTKEKPEETNKLKAEEIKKEHIEEEDNNKQIGFNSFSSFSKNDVKMEKKENEKNEKNDEMTEIIGTNRMIGDDEVRNSPSLVLEETTNKNILRGNKLVINASGLLNGNRKAKDGVAFFGRPLKKGETMINDYDLNLDFPCGASYMFIIYYKKEVKKYYIRTFKDKMIPANSLLMIKLDIDYIINKKEIISVSDNFFQINPLTDKIEIQKLAVKNNQETETFNFDNSTGLITVGRDSKCNIAFVGDKSFSKVQFSLIYDSDSKNWVLKDGLTDKPSTNGTWLYAVHSFEIIDKLAFRIGNSRLTLSYK